MSLEIVVRPASSIPVLKNGTLPPEVTSENDEAYIEWGSGSLQLAERNQIYDEQFTVPLGTRRFSISPPSTGTPPPEEQAQEALFFNEVQRSTHTLRITNPQNAENWVDVEVIDQIVFDFYGQLYAFNFNNPK